MLASGTGSAYGVPQDYSFVIDQEGIIQYKGPRANVTAIMNKIDELLSTTDVDDLPAGANRMQLHQNFPNPFNPSSTITFELPVRAQVTLSVYDANGHLVRELVNGDVAEGSHEIIWDGKTAQGNIAGSGVYFYRLKMGDELLTRKMVLLK